MILNLDRQRGRMVLADGTVAGGYLFGASSADRLPVWGEVVFNTSMTGYQEVITDPSYAGQIVVMTYPHIGNYGVTPEDNENTACAARALVVRELSPFFSPGPNRISLEAFMVDTALPGLTGVDTRAITRRIRSQGAVMAAIGTEHHAVAELQELARSHEFSKGESLVAGVTGSARGATSGKSAGPGRAAVIDLGVKKSIVDQVRALGVETHVHDASFRAEDVLQADYDFVVVSNGPGDPTDVPEVIQQVSELIGRVPLLGICLGHQLIARALGAGTYKLKFGHHGANQPVTDARTGRVFITAQNHGYAVSDDISKGGGVTVTYTNANDGTLEGFRDEKRRIECVQFHPEAAPGPNDTSFVFEQFHDQVKEWRDAASE